MKNRVAEADLSWLSNPEVFAVNRIRAHSDHWFYKKKEEVSMEEDMPLKQSLNGEWLFSYSDSPTLRKKDFYKESYDYQEFNKINVPGHIQLQGYDQCQYINTMYPWDGQEELLPPQIPEVNNPVGSYVKFFNLNENLEKEKRIFLSFQGVETAFYV